MSIAPPSPEFLARTELLRHFAPPMEALDAVRASTTAPPRLVCAAGDPYCDPPADERYAPGAGVFDVDRIEGAGHVDMVAGYGRWQSALRWCEEPAHRLGAG